MYKRYVARLYSGPFELNLEELEYMELTKLIKYTRICLFISITSFLVPCILVFIDYPNNIVLSLYLFIVTIISMIPYCIVSIKKNRYLYDLVIEELISSGYTIKYSNNTTGRITYVKNGIGRSIYVFKGKNAKGSR